MPDDGKDAYTTSGKEASSTNSSKGGSTTGNVDSNTGCNKGGKATGGNDTTTSGKEGSITSGNQGGKGAEKPKKKTKISIYFK